jgi:hypothetical protein
MSIPKLMHGNRWVLGGAICAFLMIVMMVSSALGLPIGYAADFNGCSSIEDQGKRETCCSETKSQCDSVCGDLLDDGPAGRWVICSFECEDAEVSCADGEKVKELIQWPGQPELRVPGVFVDDDRIVSDKGFKLNASTTSVVIEIQVDKGREESSTCIAAVATCNCPAKAVEYNNTRECRPIVDSGVAECRVCSVGKGSDSCKPCDDCTPVLMSVTPCTAVKPDSIENK